MAGLVRVDELIVKAYRKKNLCRSLEEAVKKLEKKISGIFLISNDPEGRKFLKTILEANGYCAAESDSLPFGIIAVHPGNPNVIRFFVVQVFRDRPPRHPDEQTLRKFHQMVLYASGFIKTAINNNGKVSSTAHWILITTRGNRIVKVDDALSVDVFLR